MRRAEDCASYVRENPVKGGLIVALAGGTVIAAGLALKALGALVLGVGGALAAIGILAVCVSLFMEDRRLVKPGLMIFVFGACLMLLGTAMVCLGYVVIVGGSVVALGGLGLSAIAGRRHYVRVRAREGEAVCPR